MHRSVSHGSRIAAEAASGMTVELVEQPYCVAPRASFWNSSIVSLPTREAMSA
jgi:hypothetical protein